MAAWAPDFLIVGAPKCGSTSVARYLGAHPDIFMVPDELHRFGSDVPITGACTDDDAYAALFQAAAPGQVRGEKSVFYLLSSRAAREINDARPDARIVAVLRAPAAMVESLHAQFLYSGNELETDIRAAIDLEEPRSRGERIPPGAHNPRGLQYTAVADYAPQLRRFIDCFGRDRVHVVVLEELQLEPDRINRELLEFLDVDPTFTPEFRIHNERKAIPSVALRRVMRTPLLRQVRRRLPDPVRRAIRDRSHVVQRQPRPDPAIRAFLAARLEHVTAETESVLGRSLDHWR